MISDQDAREFTQYAAHKLRQQFAQIERCAALLATDELWRRENEHCNSVGNLILHLTGNVRQWIVASIGGKPFVRDRPAEFAARDPRPAAEIVPPLRSAVEAAIGVITSLGAGDLGVRRSIQRYDVSTLVAVFHVVEHFSFHCGQIVHRTKALRDVDLSLYDTEGRRAAGMGYP
jgi:uncharacterized damage-inducible protein DinB